MFEINEQTSSYRWIACLPNIDPCVMKSVNSVLINGKHCIKLTVYCTLGKLHPFEAFIKSSVKEGSIELVDSIGVKFAAFSFSWERATWLPFKFDYSNIEPTEDCVILHDVIVTEHFLMNVQ